MDAQTQLELEAAAFRRLRDHLAERTDVQNIDMMNLSGFCRNCLSRWYRDEQRRRARSVLRHAVWGVAREASGGCHRCTKGRV